MSIAMFSFNKDWEISSNHKILNRDAAKHSIKISMWPLSKCWG